SASYRTKFNARIKQSEVFQGSDIEPEVKALKRMVRYDRNKDYLDQIYYAIGNLYLSRRDTAKAIDNYSIAVEKSTRSGIDKALAQITLGTLYFEQGDYDKAQPCYSEAIPKLPENYPNYKQLKRRSDFLDELAVYAQNVHLQDSLLKLSYMTPEEQTAVAERLIKELKEREKKEAEQAKLEEFRANQAAQGDQFANQNAPNYSINTDNSWYFYNSSTVTAGKTDFQRRWGSRKLEDNWRRRNKVEYAMNTSDDEEENEENAEGAEENADGDSSKEKNEATDKENDPHYVEYYLKQIPKTDAERVTCNDVIQEGLYNEGVILKDKLEDFGAAEREFNRLLTRYPDNVYRLDTYYNMYLMYMRSGNEAMAEKYRQLIINDFPDSSYGQAMRDPQYIDNLRLMEYQQEQLYADAYENYLNDKNSAVHKAYQQMAAKFPMSKLMPKFMFLDALAYVTENKPDKFKEVLTELIEKYPDTDLSPYVTSYLKGMNAGRKLHSGGSNMRGMLWDISLSNDSAATRNPNETLEFDLNPDEQQYLVLLFPTDEVSSNLLLYTIARHNFSSFAVKHYDLEQMNFGRLGLLIIKPFANVNEVNRYRSVMNTATDLDLPAQVRPVVISAKNFQTLINSGASFEDYFRYMEDKTYRDTEERVLPPELFGPSEGIPSPENEAKAGSAENADNIGDNDAPANTT
ncbi:MAG: tetratricopeptide repeat protein, partial [Muribaculaceae bacterium]|nr:tetratricopeptide repeat protein [Muribaculaceae bacterium]